METLKQYLQHHEFKVDKLGRIIIEDETLLNEIKGAIAGAGSFMPEDAGCGNGNCIC